MKIHHHEALRATGRSGLDALAVGAGRLAGEALEDDAHVFAVFEAGEVGDFLQREIGLEEELLDLGHLHAADFLLRGASEEAPEFIFLLAARGGGGLGTATAFRGERSR